MDKVVNIVELSEENEQLRSENLILKSTIQNLNSIIKELKKRKLVNSTEAFIEKAILKYGDLFDYSQVDYVSSSTKIVVICRKHGPFEIRPNSHLSGQACVKCNKELRYNNLGLTTFVPISDKREQFLSEANVVYNNKYDYSLVDYSNKTTHVNIICPNPKHGIFSQTPNIHLKGGGCPKCRKNATYKTKLNDKIIEADDDEDISEEFNEFIKMFK